VLSAYSQARDITRLRLYLETMEEVLRDNPKVVVDERVQNLVPFLPLGDLNRPAQPPAPPAQGGSPAVSGLAPQRPVQGMAPQRPVQGAVR
jgi:membrane protease subunit HflK